MSKTSYFLIALMVAAVAFLAAMRGVQVYEKRVARVEESQRSILTFQNVPINFAPQPQEPARPQPMPGRGGITRDVFLEDAPLTPQQGWQQAQETVESILADYQSNPALQAFNRDLRRSTGAEQVDLTLLSGPNLAATLAKYPQLQGIIAEHLKNPEFVKVTQEIFQNPQFVQSVSVLQRTEHAQLYGKK